MNNYLDIIENTKFPSHFVPNDHSKYYRRSLITKATGTGIYGRKYSIKLNRKINNIKKIDLKVTINTNINIVPINVTNIGCFFFKNIEFNQKPSVNLARLQPEYLLSRKNEDTNSQTYSYKQGAQTLQFDGAAIGSNAWFFVNLPLSISELQTLPVRNIDDIYLDLYLNDTAVKMGLPAGTEVTSFTVEAVIDYFEYQNVPKIEKFLGYNCFYEIKHPITLASNVITKVL